ncbi:MAG: hypothetical protein KDH09_15340 [Chrysiogenetes bacterium]|nr:hypothetical protein [Chrysiogenetes bacterium]
MSSTVTRRDAITGTAAAALIGGATLPANATDHPDAHLFALWRDYDAAAVEEDRLSAWYDRIAAEVAELHPPMPDELADLLGIPRGGKTEPLGIFREWFFDTATDAERERYHALSVPWRRECTATHPGAFDEYEAACEANSERLGSLLRKIMATDAKTPDGLLTKMRAIEAWEGERLPGEDHAITQEAFASLRQSVEIMGGRHVA